MTLAGAQALLIQNLSNQLMIHSLGKQNLSVQMALLDGGTVSWNSGWVQEKSESVADGWLNRENTWEKRIGSAFAPGRERPLDLSWGFRNQKARISKKRQSKFSTFGFRCCWQYVGLKMYYACFKILKKFMLLQLFDFIRNISSIILKVGRNSSYPQIGWLTLLITWKITSKLLHVLRNITDL